MEPLPLSTSSTESGNKNYRETTSAIRTLEIEHHGQDFDPHTLSARNVALI